MIRPRGRETNSIEKIICPWDRGKIQLKKRSVPRDERQIHSKSSSVPGPEG